MKFILLKSNNSPSEAEYDSNLNFMRKYWKYHKAVVKTSALVVIMPRSELGYTKFMHNVNSSGKHAPSHTQTKKPHLTHPFIYRSTRKILTM